MIDGMNVLEGVMRQAGARQKVIASNIANVDTPNYRAQDVKFRDVLGSAMGMTTTNAKHIGAATESSAVEIIGGDAQPWNDKNNVELDAEVAKMTENGMLFQAAVTLLEKKIQMYKTAMKTTG